MKQLPKYDYPSDYRKYGTLVHARYESVRDLEADIRSDLLSVDSGRVKHGLANILFWGYARAPGRRDDRLEKFERNVKIDQIVQFQKLVRSDQLTPSSVAKIGMPQFRNVSFISKILMFLDPSRYVVLDLKIASVRQTIPPLGDLKVDKTSVRATRHNDRAYEEWCRWCIRAAERREPGTRAVDIERAIFTLIDPKNLRRLEEFVGRL